jgi:hypothetical protein
MNGKNAIPPDKQSIESFMENTQQISAEEAGRAQLETSVERVTGLISHLVQDTLAVEEPLEIQLGHGAADA